MTVIDKERVRGLASRTAAYMAAGGNPEVSELSAISQAMGGDGVVPFFPNDTRGEIQGRWALHLVLTYLSTLE